MKLHVLGTGSSGNAYVLTAGGEEGQSLLLDAGLPIARLLKTVTEWESIAGCLLTHEHMDHAKSVEDIAALGVRVYATEGTLGALGKNTAIGFRAVEMLQAIQIGLFTVVPFTTEHDAAEPCGWLIRYEQTGETVLYATDTYYLKNTFPNVHYWIIECNYDEAILSGQLENGEVAEPLRNRLMRSHMSLRRLCDTLKANDLAEARKIILVHLSDGRSDAKKMVEEVRNASGVDDVVAAEPDTIYGLDLVPF